MFRQSIMEQIERTKCREKVFMQRMFLAISSFFLNVPYYLIMFTAVYYQSGKTFFSG